MSRQQSAEGTGCLSLWVKSALPEINRKMLTGRSPCITEGSSKIPADFRSLNFTFCISTAPNLTGPFSQPGSGMCPRNTNRGVYKTPLVERDKEQSCCPGKLPAARHRRVNCRGKQQRQVPSRLEKSSVWELGLQRFREQLFLRSSLKEEKQRLGKPSKATASMWVVNKLSQAVNSQAEPRVKYCRPCGNS